MQTKQLEIFLAFNHTWERLTPQERREWNVIYDKAQREGRLHNYQWNYWN